MIGIGINTTLRVISGGGGPSYDVDAQAFFNRVTAAGGSLTTTEQTATNQLVLDMKSAGIWTAMKAIYPMVGASAAACAQNLKSSSFTGTFTASGWTFASTGVTPNGTSAYMDTTLNMLSTFSTNTSHLSYYSRTQINALQHDMGAGAGAEANSLAISYPNQIYGYNGSSLTYTGNGNSQGLYILNASNLLLKAFKNSTQLGTSTSLISYTNINRSIWIGGINTLSPVYSSKECAFSSIGDGLTDTQASNFYTAVQAFQTTLNRQVGAQVVSDADAQAYINRVYTAGGTLTDTEANAVNQLTIDMKAAGVWTAMKAIYPMVGASAAACAQNLKSSSFTGTFSSGWTFASTGVTPNATSAYFNTTLNVSSSLTNNSTHISYYSRTNNSGAVTTEMGAGSSVSATYIQMLIYRTSGNYNGDQYFNTSLNRIDAPVSNSQGFFVDSRTNSTTHKAWKSNTLIGTDTNLNTLTTADINLTIYIGARNLDGSADLYTNRQCSFSSIGDGLTDTQASNLYTLVQSFQTTLSRQVV